MPDQTPNRLLDIVVEEVSLVDRAANKRRFLIVKRSEPDMADETTSTPPANTSTEVAGVEPSSPDETSEVFVASDPLLATAVSALEGLTSTVELLNTVGGSADPRFGPLAEELKVTARQLLERAGLSETSEESEEPPQNDAFARNIAAARDAIARLTTLSTQKAEEEGAEEAPAPSPAPEPAPPTGPSPLDSMTEALTTLTGSFMSLSEAVKEQQRRLSLLEKNVGLPHSSPSPEPVTKSGPESTAWPLDMNHPMDRESVDKSVSFHDL